VSGHTIFHEKKNIKMRSGIVGQQSRIVASAFKKMSNESTKNI